MKIEYKENNILINDSLFLRGETTKDDELKYEYDTLRPQDGGDMIAFNFRFAPGSRSKIYYVVIGDAHIEDSVYSGKGKLVRFDKKNGLRVLEVGPESKGTSIVYHKGEYLVWLAGKSEPLEIIGYNAPSNVEEQEIEIPLEDPNLPQQLRDYLKRN